MRVQNEKRKNELTIKSYQMQNMILKNKVQAECLDVSNDEKKEEIMKKIYKDRGHSNLVKVDKTGMKDIKELKEWWKTHRNKQERVNYMKQVRFEQDSGWETIATAIIDPKGPDGKTWNTEI